eukprot:NODE_109_length_18665_cov_0.924486.p12 type:complete len:211 gc:universal NODE_109_length_18665_cov_0.924486:2815-2183(-)
MHGFFSGAISGLVVDVCLFPLDTVKTRMQSKQGFLNAGGFKNIYKGLLPVLIGSMPSAGLFFSVYDHVEAPVLLRSTFGEIAACLVRVPVDNYKIHMQVSQNNFIRPFRGFRLTLFRDIPFSIIQFSIFEYFKENNLFMASIFAGSFAAIITTPLDVIRTRVILSRQTVSEVAKEAYTQKALFKGVLPRTFWIGLGGSLFLGVHEKLKSI